MTIKRCWNQACFVTEGESCAKGEASPADCEFFTPSNDLAGLTVHPDTIRIDWLTNNPLEAIEIFGRVKGDYQVRWIRMEIDDAMLAQLGKEGGAV